MSGQSSAADQNRARPSKSSAPTTTCTNLVPTAPFEPIPAPIRAVRSSQQPIDDPCIGITGTSLFRLPCSRSPSSSTRSSQQEGRSALAALVQASPDEGRKDYVGRWSETPSVWTRASQVSSSLDTSG